MHCRWRIDKTIGRCWLPECMGGAVYGPHGCTCPTGKNVSEELEDRVDQLEEQVKQLVAKTETE